MEHTAMVGYKRITRKEFYRLGGFSNPALHRRQPGNSWCYYQLIEA